MDRIIVRGGNVLRGRVEASGAKNATLPMMAAALLAEGTSCLKRAPRLKDVSTMAHLLRILGARVDEHDGEIHLHIRDCDYHEAPYELVKTMRASVYVLGPLLARLGRARVSLPGGCALGPRPIDQHIKGMIALGAEIDLEHGYVFARAERLKGGKIFFDISTVGATINCLMAATLARGTSVLANAACEPEVIAVADFLTLMGARIHGAGSSNITVEGVDSLRPAEVTVLPDRIEAGTLAIAGAMTGGEITVAACRPTDLEALTAKLIEAGVKVEEGEDELRIAAPEELQGLEIVTRPYPGFPTDLQAQMMSLLCRARGVSRITETIFPERFHHVAELRRLGADIALEDNVSSVKCVSQLSGAPVMAGDLRGSAALVLAGLVAKGETTVSRVYHLDRGYERMVEKLASLGADIERVSS